ncbi:MAG: SLC13/DASS family transporter [Lachnospiraceae bacterium]|nr:SLC13/DASS family transporter [Lachnospiraceae bacterium]
MSPTTITLLFLAFAIISFILEKIPLGLTATIVALGLNLTGILDVSQTFAGYVNSNVVLCVGMFVVGQALFETGMANRIGGLVTRFAKSERMLIIAIMIIVGGMSGFLSNTGTAAVLIPVVCGIADEANYSRSRLLMPLVFAAALGGNISIIGAPGNLMGVNALQEIGESTSFFMYAPVGIPMLLAGIVYMAFIGYRFLPDTRGAELEEAETSRQFDDIPKWKQYLSLIILIVCILAMIFEDQIGIKLQVTACVAACILVLTGVVTEKEALKSIDLKVVLLFGGSLALASALDSTGAGALIADTIVGFLGTNPNPMILLLVVFIVGCALTNFMSNTATTALMVPIASSLAASLGADPRSMIIATVIACSCAYATPIGMPANTMVVGLGGFKFKDYVKAGLPLILISFVICMVLLPILFPFYP